jgi:hypothetical protein
MSTWKEKVGETERVVAFLLKWLESSKYSFCISLCKWISTLQLGLRSSPGRKESSLLVSEFSCTCFSFNMQRRWVRDDHGPRPFPRDTSYRQHQLSFMILQSFLVYNSHSQKNATFWIPDVSGYHDLKTITKTDPNQNVVKLRDFNQLSFSWSCWVLATEDPGEFLAAGGRLENMSKGWRQLSEASSAPAFSIWLGQ